LIKTEGPFFGEGDRHSLGEMSDTKNATNDERENCYSCQKHITHCPIHDKPPQEPRQTIVFQRVQEIEVTFSQWQKYLRKVNHYDERYHPKEKILSVWKRMCNLAHGNVVIVEDYDVPELDFNDVKESLDDLIQEAYEQEEEEKKPPADRRV
jgi:hypothetical protein